MSRDYEIKVEAPLPRTWQGRHPTKEDCDTPVKHWEERLDELSPSEPKYPLEQRGVSRVLFLPLHVPYPVFTRHRQTLLFSVVLGL